jgi:hypothetical protein
MTMRARLAGLAFASLATFAGALETPAWPPPAGVEARMRELQLVIIDRDSTAPQREAAREELSSLLKSPAGQARGRTPDEKPARPARAAIEPFPSVVKPTPPLVSPSAPSPGVAQVEVIEPPKRLVVPQTGSVLSPSSRFAIDPRTGSILHETPAGYIDPRTGQFIPR